MLPVLPALLAFFAAAPPGSGSGKSVVVRVANLRSVSGTLQRFKDGKAVGKLVRVTVGSRGVSADRREGDNTTPLGTFLPGLATGYSATPPTGTALEYRRATETLKCVDDPSSRYYNRIVDERSVTKDWTSAEDMRRKDSAYSRVIELKYNTDPAVPGKGSCIFLHVWKNAETGTAGCVAMSSEDMETLLAWIERDTKVTVEVGD